MLCKKKDCISHSNMGKMCMLCIHLEKIDNYKVKEKEGGAKESSGLLASYM